MNYILEIKAFYDTLDTQTLPAGAISLWHALMHVANKTRWKESFTVPLTVLELKTGLTKQSVIRSRDLLAKLGYIKVSAAKGRSETATYSMVSLEYGADGSADGADGMADGSTDGSAEDTDGGRGLDEAKKGAPAAGKEKRRGKETSVSGGGDLTAGDVPMEGSECLGSPESGTIEQRDCRSELDCETPEEDEGPPPDFAEWLASVTGGCYGDDDSDYADDSADVNNYVNTHDTDRVNTDDTDYVNTYVTVPVADGVDFDAVSEAVCFDAGVNDGVNTYDNNDVNTDDTDDVTTDGTANDTVPVPTSAPASVPVPDGVPDYCSSYGEPYYDPDYVPDYGPFADSDFDPTRHRFERGGCGAGAREVQDETPDYCSSYGEPYYDPDYVPDYGPFADSDFDPTRHRFDRVNTPPEAWADSGAGLEDNVCAKTDAETAVIHDVNDRVNTDVNYHVNTYVTKHANTDVNGGVTINKLNVNVNDTLRDKTKLESESEKEKEKESEGEDEEGRACAQSSRVCEGEKISPSPCGGTSPGMAPAAADKEHSRSCDGLNVPDGLISREKLEEFFETRSRYIEKGYPPERVDAFLMPLWGLVV